MGDGAPLPSRSAGSGSPTKAVDKRPAPGRIDGAVVVHEGADHVFVVPAAKGSIARVDIVDVDLVLTLKDGHRLILEGGAVDAFSQPDAQVSYEDGQADLGGVVQQVGAVRIDEQPFIAQSSPVQSDLSGENDKASDQEAQQVATPAQVPPPPPEQPQQGAYDNPPVFYVSNIIYASPPAHQSPQTPTFNESTNISAELEARTGTTLANGTLTGSFGAAGADTNPSAAAQMAPQVIANGSPDLAILANNLSGEQFIKILHVGYVGSGSVSSITLSGLGAGFSIIGASPDASGVYHLSSTAFASSQGANQFDIPIEYNLDAPNPAQPTHESFQVSLSLGVTGQAIATYQKTLTFVEVDAVTAADVTNAASSANVLVFPAQGIGYQLTAYGLDTITGGRNDDTIYASGGGNLLDGAGGVNTLDYSAQTTPETINAAAGEAIGAGGVDTITNFQDLIGASVSSLIIGSTSTLYEASGSAASEDTFESGGGGSAAAPETVAGGASGDNTLSYADATGPVNVNLTTGVATGFGVQAVSGVQNLIGSAYDDTLVGALSTLSMTAGGPQSNTLFDPGGGGTPSALETITGSALGFNTVTYANAAEAVSVNLTTGLATGDGFQALSDIQAVIGSNFDDDLVGSSSTLKLQGGSGADTFDGGGGGSATAPESIYGGDGGRNLLTFANAPGGVVVNLQAGVAYGSTVPGQGYGYEVLSNIQYVIGSAYSDSLVGTLTTKELQGGAGGNDTFDGGGGGVSTDPESIIGSASGINTASYASSGVGVTVNLSPGPGRDGYEEGYGVQDLQNIQAVMGSAYSDSIRGSTSATFLSGGAGGQDTFDPGGGGTPSAPETVIGSPQGPNTLSFLADPSGGVVADLQTGVVNANAYGYDKVSAIQIIVGTPLGNDSLTGSSSTLMLEAGSVTANDTFDGGGGGTASAPETILGGALGTSNTLTFANDHFGKIDANLANGFINAGGAAGYGYIDISGIQRLIGSAAGGDTLIGAPGVLYISSPSTIAGDTFDGGGGGTSAQPEYLVGAGGVSNTLTFSEDTASGTAGGVVVDLQPVAAGQYGEVTGPYGVEYVSNISTVYGSANGDDSLTGSSGGSDLIAGAGDTTLVASGGQTTLQAGGGEDSLVAEAGRDLLLAGGGPETIVGDGAITAANADTLSFANAAEGVVVNLQTGLASGAGALTLKGEIAEVIGSPFNDVLTGAPYVQALIAGAPTSSDTFDGGGGGDEQSPEIIKGGQYGVNTLTFANDTLASVDANLAAGTVDAGGSTGYGYYQVSNIQELIGSAVGGDLLKGTTSTVVIDGSHAAAGDTFDGGGGGSQSKPEQIIGADGVTNTLQFSGDTTQGAAGGIYVDLASNVMRSGVYGYESLTNIEQVIGSAYGSDTLIGGGVATDLVAGGGADEIQAGAGGGTLAGGTGSDTIDASIGRDLVILGGGATTVLGSALVTGANADTLDFATATGPVRVNLLTLSASGYGPTSLTGAFAGLIGSANTGDSLVGSPSTLYVSGGSGAEGVIDPGGGGNLSAPETLIGGSGGLYTLSFANDASFSINANLSSGSAALGGAGTVDALAPGDNPGGYGYDVASKFQILVGSALGGDTLTGGPGMILVTAGQATVDGLAFTNLVQLNPDTFDGGGGGTAAAPEYLIGAPGLANTLSFASDTLAGAAGGAEVNLSTDTLPGGYGTVLVGGAVELVQNIPDILGSPHGQDTLIGDGSGNLIRAGGGLTLISEIQGANAAAVNTLVGGAGGGTIDGSRSSNLIYAGSGALSIFYAAGDDTLAFNNAQSAPGPGLVVNLAQGFATLPGGVVDTLTGSGAGAAIVELIGGSGDDSLIGASSTETILAGASTGNDAVAPGGGGSASKPEVLIGGSQGVNTLTYAADSVSAITAALGSGTVAGSIVSSLYGDQTETNFEKLIGSFYGGDSLHGAPTTLVLQSGSTQRGDTFDPGGGGSLAAPETVIGGGGSTTNTITAAGDSVQGVTITLSGTGGTFNGLNPSGGAGYGYAVLTDIQAAVGSAKGGDSLTGSSATVLLAAGSGSGDTFVAGGGGTLAAPETIRGNGAGGVYLLTYASDTVASMVVNLTTGAATSAGNAYGAQSVSGITELYGSGKGGDSLTGSPTALLIEAVGTGSTIDGGGGGNAANFETITGSTLAGAQTTLSFASDSVHGVSVNLATGSVNGGGAWASGGYGYETLSGVTGLLGSAKGGDSLVGSAATTSIAAGAGSGDTFAAGGGGSSAAPETIRGSATGVSLLTYAADTGGAIQANLGSNSVSTTGYGVQKVYSIDELIGSAVGGDVLSGTTTTLLLSAAPTASVGDTFFGGGGGSLTAPETITGGSATGNDLSFAQDSGSALTVSLSSGSITSAGYGVEQFSKIQEIDGSALGGDQFLIGSTLATGGVTTLRGSAVGTDTLSFAADTAASGGVDVNLSAGSVTGAVSFATVAQFADVVGSAAGADTFVTGGGWTGDLNPTYSFWMGTGADSIVTTVAGSSAILYVNAAGGSASITTATGIADTLNMTALTSGETLSAAAAGETLSGSSYNATVTGGLLSDVVGAVNVATPINNALSFASLASGAINADLATGSVSGSVTMGFSNFDQLTGSAAGADTLTGGTVNDTLIGGGGSGVAITTGSAKNLVIVGSGSESVNATPGTANTLSFQNDTTSASLSVNLKGLSSGLVGNASLGAVVDTVSGTVTALIGSAAGGDSLVGYTGLQSITGVGADTFDGGGGTLSIADTTAAATSTLSFQSDSVGTPAITVNLASGAATGYGTLSFAGSNIHDVIGSPVGTDLITVDAPSDDIILGGAASTIAGPSSGGQDTLSFQLSHGAITVNLAAGSFSGYGAGSVTGSFADLIGGHGAGALTGSASTTYIYGGVGAGDVIADPGAGSLAAPATLIGGAGGADTLSLAGDSVGGVSVTLPSATASIAAGGATVAGWGSVAGGAYGDWVLSEFQNLIGSAAGGDTLKGSASTLSIAAGPTLAGSLGDTFDGGGGGTAGAPESLTGAAGLGNTVTFANDTLLGAAGGVVVNLLHDTVGGAYGVEALANIETVIGSAGGNDSITGDANPDVFYLGAGADTVSAGSGLETIYAGTGGDLITASAGHDLVSFANDAAGGLTAHLTTSGGTITGYGLGVTVSGGALEGLVGSAGGGDDLIGSTATSLLTAPASAENDTFVGGGGGTAGAYETLTGGAHGGNVVSYAASTGAVNVNLLTGVETSASYGYESLSNMQEVIGSASGNDTFTADNNGDYFVSGTGAITVVTGAGNDTIDALAASGGTITASAARTSASAADLIEIGSSFFSAISASDTTPAINPGAGSNTLKIDWQTGSGSTTFNFDSLTPNATVTGGASAVQNISTVDFTGDTLASAGATYTITAQEIINMSPSASLNVQLPKPGGGYTGLDAFQVSLSGSQSLVIGAQGAEYIYSDATHAHLLATIHLT